MEDSFRSAVRGKSEYNLKANELINKKLLKEKQNFMNECVGYGINIMIFIIYFALMLISIAKSDIFCFVLCFGFSVYFIYYLLKKRKWYFKEYYNL